MCDIFFGSKVLILHLNGTIFYPSPFVKHFCGLNLILVFRNLNPFLFEMIIHWTFLTAAKKPSIKK
jgi:hypothetical protein